MWSVGFCGDERFRGEYGSQIRRLSGKGWPPCAGAPGGYRGNNAILQREVSPSTIKLTDGVLCNVNSVVIKMLSGEKIVCCVGWWGGSGLWR